MNFGSNINWKAQQDESMRRTMEFREQERQRQIFESVYNPSINRNDAAGAVSSGGSTETGKQSASTEIFMIIPAEGENYQIYIFDYVNKISLGPIDSGIAGDINLRIENRYVPSDQYVLDGKGYGFTFHLQSTSSIYVAFFVDSIGNIIETFRSAVPTTDYSMDFSSGKYLTFVDYDQNIACYFDGTKVYHIEDLIENSMWQFGSSSNYWNSTKGMGLYIGKIIDGVEYVIFYLLDEDGHHLIFRRRIDSGLGEVPFLYPYASYVVSLAFDSGTGFPKYIIVYNLDGSILQSIEIGDNIRQYDFRFFGTEKFCCILWSNADESVPYQIVSYDGSSDTVQSFNHDRGTDYFSYRLIHDEKYNADVTSYQSSESFFVIFYNFDGTSNNYFEITSCDIVCLYPDQIYETIQYLSSTPGLRKYLMLGYSIINADTLYIPALTDLSTLAILVINFDSVSYLADTEISGNDYFMDSIRMFGDKVIYSVMNNDTSLGVIQIIKSIDFLGYLNYDATTWIGSTYDAYFNLSYNIAVFRTPLDEYWLNSENEWSHSNIVYTDYIDQSLFRNDNIEQLGTSYRLVLETKPRPHIYWFNDARYNNTEPSGIIDFGGNDMFDGGNMLYTNLNDGGLYMPYTHTQMDSSIDDSEATLSDFTMDGSVQDGSSWFGPSSSYFTNLYPGMFVMVADGVTGITEFYTDGGLGSDANTHIFLSGATSITHNGHDYTIYRKFTGDFNNGDPSVNKFIIIPTNGDGESYNISVEGEDRDYQQVIFSTNVPTQIHYLLLSQSHSNALTEEVSIEVVDVYLSLIDPIGSTGPLTIGEMLSTLNDNYERLTAGLPSHEQSSSNDAALTSYDGTRSTGIIKNGVTLLGNNRIASIRKNEVDGNTEIYLYDEYFNILNYINTGQSDTQIQQIIDKKLTVVSNEGNIDRFYFIVDDKYDMIEIPTADGSVYINDSNDFTWWYNS